MTEPTEIDGVPEEFLDAAVDVGWGMGFSHLRRQISAVMPLHERMVRAKVADEIEAEYRRREQDGLAIGPLLHAADIARNGATDAPQGTGDAHTPKNGHGEGSGDSKASRGRSEAQEGEG